MSELRRIMMMFPRPDGSTPSVTVDGYVAFLSDFNDMVSGSRIATDGNVETLSDWSISGYIEIPDDARYVYYDEDIDDQYTGLYDSSKTYIGHITKGNAVSLSAKYLRVSMLTDNISDGIIVILKEQREMPVPVLPYDAQVEYLETPASDNGYIEIPCNVTNGCVITIDGYIVDSNKELFCLPLNGAISSSSYQFNIETSATYYRFFFTRAINAGSNNLSVRHTWMCGTSLYRDGALIASQTPTFSDTRDGIWIFRGTHGYAKGRIYSLKFDDESNNIHIDCIPVRVGQVGYLYDKVSGDLFGNSGTGSFTYGNDVNE